MPFAGFKDFEDCISQMKSDGKSDESANNICGALKRDFEKESLKERINKLFEHVCTACTEDEVDEEDIKHVLDKKVLFPLPVAFAARLEKLYEINKK